MDLIELIPRYSISSFYAFRCKHLKFIYMFALQMLPMAVEVRVMLKVVCFGGVSPVPRFQGIGV